MRLTWTYGREKDNNGIRHKNMMGEPGGYFCYEESAGIWSVHCGDWHGDWHMDNLTQIEAKKECEIHYVTNRLLGIQVRRDYAKEWIDI